MPIGSRTRRGRRMWLFACLVLTVAGVFFAGQRNLLPAFFQTTGILKIDTNPQGALVFVDGVQRAQTPAEISLDPGEHTVDIRLDGETRTLPVVIAAGTTASQYLELPKVIALTGELQISTEPSGARVSVDGQPRGTSKRNPRWADTPV